MKAYQFCGRGDGFAFIKMVCLEIVNKIKAMVSFFIEFKYS